VGVLDETSEANGFGPVSFFESDSALLGKCIALCKWWQNAPIALLCMATKHYWLEGAHLREWLDAGSQTCSGIVFALHFKCQLAYISLTLLLLQSNVDGIKTPRRDKFCMVAIAKSLLVAELATRSGGCFLTPSRATTMPRLRPESAKLSTKAVSPSSSFSSTSSAYTWIAAYKIEELSRFSNLQSLHLNWQSAFNYNSDKTIAHSMTSPAEHTASSFTLQASTSSNLSALDGLGWSRPPPATASLAKLWTVWHRPGTCSDKPLLAGVAGLPECDEAGPFLLADKSLRQEEEVCNLILRALEKNPVRHSSSATQYEADGEEKVERVSWVNNHGHDLLPKSSKGLPRPLMHRLNVLHKGAGILVRDAQSRVFVHQRSAHKRIFPSLYDMFVGGVSLFREDTKTTARRELQEELGFGPAASAAEEESTDFRFLFDILVETSYNRCFVDVYEYVVEGGQEESAKLDPEEVQWGDWIPMEEVTRRVLLNGLSGEWTFVPDGLLVWAAFLRATDAGSANLSIEGSV